VNQENKSESQDRDVSAIRERANRLARRMNAEFVPRKISSNPSEAKGMDDMRK